MRSRIPEPTPANQEWVSRRVDTEPSDMWGSDSEESTMVYPGHQCPSGDTGPKDLTTPRNETDPATAQTSDPTFMLAMASKFHESNFGDNTVNVFSNTVTTVESPVINFSTDATEAEFRAKEQVTHLPVTEVSSDRTPPPPCENGPGSGMWR